MSQRSFSACPLWPRTWTKRTWCCCSSSSSCRQRSSFLTAEFPRGPRRQPMRLPLGQPLGQPLADVDAVGDQLDARGAFQGLQAANDGHHFHAVIGGFAFAAAR